MFRVAVELFRPFLVSNLGSFSGQVYSADVPHYKSRSSEADVLFQEEAPAEILQWRFSRRKSLWIWNFGSLFSKAAFESGLVLDSVRLPTDRLFLEPLLNFPVGRPPPDPSPTSSP